MGAVGGELNSEMTPSSPEYRMRCTVGTNEGSPTRAPRAASHEQIVEKGKRAVVTGMSPLCITGRTHCILNRHCFVFRACAECPRSRTARGNISRRTSVKRRARDAGFAYMAYENGRGFSSMTSSSQSRRSGGSCVAAPSVARTPTLATRLINGAVRAKRRRRGNALRARTRGRVTKLQL
ncbi:jg17740 [Pararge aegeria aegeria]|uniref:Jg17740 protein n=1 Tax=Pararge aegeria aegeria TaxID=348720 RepID=A0A8S4S7R9_9NEOP|nr:jg17740 [Pararge aegeria aegeria]